MFADEVQLTVPVKDIARGISQFNDDLKRVGKAEQLAAERQ